MGSVASSPNANTIEIATKGKNVKITSVFRESQNLQSHSAPKIRIVLKIMSAKKENVLKVKIGLMSPVS